MGRGLHRPRSAEALGTSLRRGIDAPFGRTGSGSVTSQVVPMMLPPIHGSVLFAAGPGCGALLHDPSSKPE